MKASMKWFILTMLLLLIISSMIVPAVAQTETVLYRVNVGGPELPAIEAGGPVWGQDLQAFPNSGNSPYLAEHSTGGSLYNGNSSSAHPGAIEVSTDIQTNYPNVPVDIFNTERYDAASSPEALWQFPITPGTEIELRLFFAELFGQIDQAGERVFDVSVEGIVPAAFEDIDPFAIAGAKGAVVLTTSLVVTDGTLDVQFIHQTENPALKGIEIIELNPPSNAAPVVEISAPADGSNVNFGDEVTFTGTANDTEDGDLSAFLSWESDIDGSMGTGASVATDTLSDGTHTITASVSDTGGLPGSDSITITVVGEPEPLADFCINIGGTAYTAFDRSFLADNTSGTSSPYFTSGGTKFGAPGNSNTENIVTLANASLLTDEVNIFQTERYGGAPSGSAMVLDLGFNNNLTGITSDGSLPNGDYTVDLYFAEIFVGVQNGNGAGARVFDVTVEGNLVLDDLDLFTVPEPDAPLTGMVFSYPVTVSDGNLTVVFDASVDNAKLSAVCVSPNDGSDVTAPVITLLGDDPLELTVGDAYVEPGATATDDASTDAILRVTPDASAVDTNTAGSYNVTYTATDAAGNSVQVSRTVNVTSSDTEAPVITLLGDDPLELTVGDPYVEPGATATDNVDGDISANIVIDASAVDTSTVGSYDVTYNVSDAAGNAAVEQIRVVNVSAAPDTEAPVITLLGDNPLELTVGDPYVEPGATATDNVDGDISANIVIDASAVDTSTVGSYNVTYNVSDAAGNAAVEQIRVVNVSAAPDTEAPVITLLGDNPLELTVGDPYVEPGATATDNVDGDISANIVIDASAVDTSTVGSYNVTYNVSDAAGNAAVEQIRVVNVSEPEPLANVCINIGGTAYTAFGRSFISDNPNPSPFFSSSTSKFGNPTSAVTENIVTLANVGLSTDEVNIFQTERYGGAPSGSAMVLDLGFNNNLTGITSDGSLPNGDYTVDLYFAEIFVGVQSSGANLGAGDRVFDVTVEGNLVLDDLDLFTVPEPDAPLTAIVYSYPVAVSDGSLTVEFAASVDNAKLSAVCVSPNDGSDVTAPVITLLGDDPLELTVGDTYVEPGATATDDTSTDAILRVIPDASAVDISTAGSYNVTYTATDAAGNFVQVSRTVNVTAPDTEAPVITLVGDNPLELTVGDAYVEPGATATDNVDGDISGNIVIDASAVDTSTVGSYDVTYNVSDAAGNAAVEQIRVVNVVEAVIPGVPQAFVAIDPSGNSIDGSTFNGGFTITNQSTEGLQITSFSLDLSGAMYPNMVFDPLGTAGDAAGLCFTPVSSSATATGLVAPANPCADPFSAPFGNGGFQVVSASFTDFAPGESFSFAVDVDPTSIENATSTGSSGSVSGLELAGATYTVTFANGSVLGGEIYRVQPDSLDGAANTLTSDPISAAPGLSVLDTAPVANGSYQDTTVDSLLQTVQISGPVGANLSLLVIESDYLVGTPSIDPFEANIAQVVSEYDAVIGAGGTVDIPVTLTDGASGDLYYLAAVIVEPDGRTSDLSTVWRLQYIPGTPVALIEINPGGGLNASTFSGSSFQITNNSQGGTQITSVSINLATGILPDMVFDPVGSGGDATASCLTANSGAVATGLIVPTDPCVDPYSQPRNGGFDILTVDFSDFDPGEQFFFTTDVDPNSIQGVSGAGNAGAVSGYELIGATVTVTFSNGATLTSSLYEDGSLGGSQAVVTEGATAAPSIAAQGVSSPAIVNDLNQMIVITGTPGQYYSLLQMDTRLYIASGDPPFNVTPAELPFYANEAMAGKNVFNGIFDADGVVEIPVTLLQSTGATGTPDGGLNYFIAVSSNTPYAVDQQVSQTSNEVIMKYEEQVQNTPPQIAFLTNVGSGISVEEGDVTAVQFTVTDAESNLDTVEVTGANFITLVDNGNGIYTATFEPQVGDAGPYTITVTATDTESAQDTQAFSLTVTELQATTLTGSFTLQGRSDYAVDLAVNLYPVGSTTAAYSFNVTASSQGEFTINNIAPDIYQIAVKHSQSLQMVDVVTINQGANTYNFGELRMGDVNGDNLVSALDFSLLASGYNTQVGDPGYNPNADLNADGTVGALDFSLLASNYNVAGENPQP